MSGRTIDPCVGRRQHQSRDDAIANPVNGTKIYRCPSCGNWHGTERDRLGLAKGEAMRIAAEAIKADIPEDHR